MPGRAGPRLAGPRFGPAGPVPVLVRAMVRKPGFFEVALATWVGTATAGSAFSGRPALTGAGVAEAVEAVSTRVMTEGESAGGLLAGADGAGAGAGVATGVSGAPAGVGVGADTGRASL